jgi:cell division protein FtsA
MDLQEKERNKYVVAIDLGTTKLISIVGERCEDGRCKILAYSEAPSSGIQTGQIENIKAVADALMPTLNKIKAETNIEIREVYVGIAGLHITCIENPVERIRDRFDKLISAEEIMKLETDAGNLHLNTDQEILHIIPRTYSIDDTNGITDPVGRLGHKLTGYFYVITGSTTIRTHVKQCMELLNLSLKAMVLEPIASAKATLDDDEKEMGVVMIDIGGGTTDLIIYHENKVIHTAVIPLGGDSITYDIKMGCNILGEQAEKIKIKFGLSIPDEYDNNAELTIDGINGRKKRHIPLSFIAKIIAYRCAEIVDMVMKEIEKAKCAKYLSMGIVVTGGVSEMKGIKKFLEEKTGMEVKTGVPDRIANESDPNIIQPKFSTAVGLIMYGIEHNDKPATVQYADKVATQDKIDATPPEDPNRQGNDNTNKQQDKKPDRTSAIHKLIEKTGNAFKAFLNPQQEENND